MSLNTDKMFKGFLVLVPALIILNVLVESAKPVMFKDHSSSLVAFFGDLFYPLRNQVNREDRHPFYLIGRAPVDCYTERVRLNNVKEKYYYGALLPKGELSVTLYYSCYNKELDIRKTPTVTFKTMINETYNYKNISFLEAK
jgi:hypothetical protein